MSDGFEVCVLGSYPDKRFHGYVGRVIDTRGHEVRVKFGLKIGNETDEAWIPFRHVRYVIDRGDRN